MNTMIKSIVALSLTAAITVGSLLMIGPQIMVIVPVAMLAGIIFAVRRSFLSLPCFGYPLTFGLLSALIGCAEIDGYTRTPAFAISLGIGVVGIVLIAAGLWKTLPGGHTGKTGRPAGGGSPS